MIYTGDELLRLIDDGLNHASDECDKRGITTDDLLRSCVEEIVKLKSERDDAVRRMEQGWIQVCAEPAINEFKQQADEAKAALAEARGTLLWLNSVVRWLGVEIHNRIDRALAKTSDAAKDNS